MQKVFWTQRISHPRVFCTTQTLFCTGARSGCTGARGVSLAGSKRPVAPSPNHFCGFPLFTQFARSVASKPTWPMWVHFGTDLPLGFALRRGLKNPLLSSEFWSVPLRIASSRAWKKLDFGLEKKPEKWDFGFGLAGKIGENGRRIRKMARKSCFSNRALVKAIFEALKCKKM